MNEYALQLPNNYVEIDRDEMEYVDGGASWVQNFLVSTLATVVGGLICHAVTTGMVKTALVALGGWVANTFYSIAAWAAFNPQL